jgi:hypothetical protein
MDIEQRREHFRKLARAQDPNKTDWTRWEEIMNAAEEMERDGLMWVDEATGRWRLTEKGKRQEELKQAKRELKRAKRKGAKAN